jgi:TonB family protein
MNRIALAALLSLAAPAANGWVRCDQPGIKPPVPIRREAPAYPEPVRATGIEGTVEVALTVLRDGTVGWVRTVRAEPRGYFEQAAARGVRNWRFTPAQADGVAIECRMVTRVRFTLVDTVAVAPVAVAGARPEPVYPPALLRERVEGYVEVAFERAPDGSVQNARVITAMPRGEFEDAALAAIRGWRLSSVPGPARRETRRFEFRLPDSALAAVPPTTLASAPFPMAACKRRAAGHVALEVDTDASGRVLKARILAAEPAELFDATALTVARASRLTPAYRDGQAIAATGLLTLFFDAAQATCPGVRAPERAAPPKRPLPRVGGHDEPPDNRGDRFCALSTAFAQPLP